MKLQIEELTRLKENRNKTSSAGQAAKIDKFATERTHSYILETVERLNEELENMPIQVEMGMQHTTLKDSLFHYLAFFSLYF